ncbi:MAG: PadR family transcriptional regulator [Thermoleophilia bacterium]
MSVRHAILALLAQQPRHGYDLHRTFEAIVGGKAVWDVKPAQVYTTLVRLEEAGLVAQTTTRRVGGPDQHVYELTPMGRDELDRWYADGTHSTHQHDEVFLKITLALGDERVDPLAVLRTERTSLYRHLHALTTRRGELVKPHNLGHALLLEKATMHIEADLRWLEMVEAKLHDMARLPAPGTPTRRRGRPRRSPENT